VAPFGPERRPPEQPLPFSRLRAPGSSMVNLLQRVNEVMREGRDGRTEPELIPFFCECGQADCDEPLLLTADAYDERRADPEDSLTLPGHAPSSAPRQWLQDDP
jgi:hypothetical protein